MNKSSKQTSKDLEYWNNKWNDKKTSYSTKFAQKAYKDIKNRGFQTVLDLGCGSGNDSIYFHSKGLSVTAIDYSEIAINSLKSKTDGIEAFQSDIAEMDFLDNQFDVVYAHLSLHYFDDDKTLRIFDTIYKILKPGGYFFVKCRSVEDESYGQGVEIEKNFFVSNHVRHFFTREYMKEKLNKFEIVSLRRVKSSKGAFIEATAKKTF